MPWNYDEDTDHGTERRMLTVQRPITGFTFPTPGRFFLLFDGNPGQPTIQFTTALTALPPGQYQITSEALQSACNVHWNERTFYFQVAGVPRPPPAPTANLFGWARSPHDGPAAGFVATEHNPDPAHFAWSYGGIMEFYPDLDLTLPAAPGYLLTTTITGWHFRGSPPLDAAPVDRALAYRQPIRILWSKYPPPELHAPEVDGYRIARVDAPVALVVVVDFTYTLTDPSGVALPPISGSVEGQFTVDLVYTQVLDGGHS